MPHWNAGKVFQHAPTPVTGVLVTDLSLAVTDAAVALAVRAEQVIVTLAWFLPSLPEQRGGDLRENLFFSEIVCQS